MTRRVFILQSVKNDYVCGRIKTRLDVKRAVKKYWRLFDNVERAKK